MITVIIENVILTGSNKSGFIQCYFVKDNCISSQIHGDVSPGSVAGGIPVA